MNESDISEPISQLTLQEAGVRFVADREHAVPKILHEKGWSWQSIDPLTRLVVASSAFVVTNNQKIRGQLSLAEFAEDYQRVFWQTSHDELVQQLNQDSRPGLQRRVVAEALQHGMVGEMIWTASEMIILSDNDYLAKAPAIAGGVLTRQELLIEQLHDDNQQGAAISLRSLALLAISKYKDAS